MNTVVNTPSLLDRSIGCLLGGAIGDALGWPVEFMTMAEIRKKFGPGGIQGFAETSGGLGVITDDTQMTLFTTEGLLQEYKRISDAGASPDYPASIYQAYLRWLFTQGEVSRDPQFPSCLDGDLLKIPQLHHRRAPGSTCLTALIAGKMGTVGQPVNMSKGCGGVMRVAPVGLFCRAIAGIGEDRKQAELAFDLGCAAAAITHGHPLGYLPAGFLAALTFFLVSGKNLEDSISESMLLLVDRPEYEKSTLSAMLSQAVRYSMNEKPTQETVERLGGGWVGDEALSISVYCAMAAKGDFDRGVQLAVNHSGDSDSTGAIVGNILGTLLGRDAISEPWLRRLELREQIEVLAGSLAALSI